MKISVVINTYNAEKYLERVLESVKEFDEILICDMYSNDRTLEIAKKYDCRVIYHENIGWADPARKYAILQATHEWVLVVDSDELVTAGLRKYLYEYIQKEKTENALSIPFKNFKFGHFMHCAYPDKHVRFIRKDKFVDWPASIHSKAVIDGKTGEISNRQKDLAFIHLANEPVELTIHKMNFYTNKERERRKKRNYGWFALIFHPIFRFFRLYIAKGGIRDGKAGFIWAVESAYYKFITIAKVIESQIDPDKDWDDDIKP
jgi:glycosyltransferase involved in cell wall biosynthesis